MTLIPAQATVAHAKHFAQLAQIASDNLYHELLGKNANAVLEAMFSQTNNDSSYRHTSFLQEGDRIAGMLTAYTAQEARSQSRRTTWLMLRYARLQFLRCLAVGILLSPLLDFLGSHLERDDFYIAMIALYPPYRGRGHSKTILHHAQHLARERGCSRLALDVDERNRIAIAAYRRAGFERIDQSKEVRLAGEYLRVLRMAKRV